MKKIPQTEHSLVLRTDFSNEPAWKRICALIEQPEGDFMAYVDFVSDPEFDGVEADQLLELMDDETQTFAFIVDKITVEDPDHPILVVDLFSEPGRTFRAIPAEMWAVENNLSVANMDFEDFANAVDAKGIFRGFPET